MRKKQSRSGPGEASPDEGAQLSTLISADWKANPGNSRVRFVLVSFRIASWSLAQGPVVGALFAPGRVLYKVVAGWILGVDLPAGTTVGQGLCIQHGYGLVVHHRAIIGRFCTLRQGVTLGIRGTGSIDDLPPVLGDRVNVGSAAQILGAVRIGDDAKIGAGSIVLIDVPPGATAVGNPGHLVR